MFSNIFVFEHPQLNNYNRNSNSIAWIKENLNKETVLTNFVKTIESIARK